MFSFAEHGTELESGELICTSYERVFFASRISWGIEAALPARVKSTVKVSEYSNRELIRRALEKQHEKALRSCRASSEMELCNRLW